jgi:hypothetical protein
MNFFFPHIRIPACAHARAANRRLGQNGFTLVEALVAGTVGLVVAGTIFYAANLASSGMQDIQAQQQLEQESSLITETFVRAVRNGNYICVGNATASPGADTDNVASITVRAKDSTVATTFTISGDSLQMNGNRYLTGYLSRYRTPLSHFKVLQNGKTALCYLSMIQVLGSDTTYYTQTIGEVQCKN